MNARGDSGTRDVGVSHRLNRAAMLLAGCVLLDSAFEHYRGAFHNKTMIAPLVSASLSLAAGAHGTGDEQPRPQRARHAISALALLTGLVGTGFHLYNIGKRTGGYSSINLFYGAPVGAPAALVLTGLLGAAAERTRSSSMRRPWLLRMPTDRSLALLASAGLIGTVGEVSLLHLRGAFHNPAMYLPVSVPPIAAAFLARAAFRRDARSRRRARAWLRATALLGLVGVGFHSLGVARNMGGWRNWSQNILNGPPLPAPPSFTALALAGLAALRLQKRSGASS